MRRGGGSLAGVQSVTASDPLRTLTPTSHSPRLGRGWCNRTYRSQPESQVQALLPTSTFRLQANRRSRPIGDLRKSFYSQAGLEPNVPTNNVSRLDRVTQARRGWITVGVGILLGMLCVLAWTSAVGFQVWALPDWTFWPLHVAWLAAIIFGFRQVKWWGLLTLLPVVPLIPFVAFAALITAACVQSGSCP